MRGQLWHYQTKDLERPQEISCESEKRKGEERENRNEKEGQYIGKVKGELGPKL